jgi:ABC-type branched-subunit amino acid transport system substrate-binding protein
MDTSRREFLHLAGSAALLLAARDPRLRLVSAAEPLRIGIAGAAEGAARGATMGVEEAARTGEMLGRAVEARSGGVEAAERLVREERVAALVGGADEASAREIGALADRSGVPFVNVGAAADALRGAECRRNVFHVEASQAMYTAALAARGEGAADAARAVLWHPALERFGAAQLNDRFRARFGVGMDGAAWAGWMAVKVLWEASLRARSVEPAALRAYLERPATQFDGHKGWPLSFRPWDHQLRQPLYLASPDGARVRGEVPRAAGEGGATARELLDRLGGAEPTSTCRMQPEETR